MANSRGLPPPSLGYREADKHIGVFGVEIPRRNTTRRFVLVVESRQTRSRRGEKCSEEATAVVAGGGNRDSII